jgi:hypothetical protein
MHGLKEEPLVPIESRLIAIQEQLDQHPWTIEDLFQAMKKKGYPFLILLLILPFCQPIQIPGLSIPFGIVLMVIGLRMAVGRRIWWPQSVVKKTIPSRLLSQVINKSLGFIQFLHRFTSQRLIWLCADGFWYQLNGWFVVLMGFYLALPLPIPLSNLPGAWSLFFLALGLLEDDGLFIVIAYVMGITTVVAFILLIFLFKEWIAMM